MATAAAMAAGSYPSGSRDSTTSAVRRPISEVGPVERSTQVSPQVLSNRGARMGEILTLGGAHERVDGGRQPAGHQAVFDGDRGNRRICQTLGDQHDAQGQTRDHVADGPSRIVLGQPPYNGDFVEQIANGRSR